MELRSSLLFARPSFIEGVARLSDFGGTLNEYNTFALSSRAAIALDWAHVGAALWDAVETLVVENDLPRLYEPRTGAKAQSSGVR